MAVVARLLTFVDLDAKGDDGPDARRMSVRARHEAVLTDGRRVVLLDDRGWSEQLSVSLSIWAFLTVEGMERTARVVVGPDAPFEAHTEADMAASHWDSLAQVLRDHRIEVEGDELRALPHDVELSDRVRARIGRNGADAH